MKRYKNLNGSSGVIAYEIHETSILVQFQGGETYVYNEMKPGKLKVRKMKSLAESGSGLSTYISQVVRNNFYKKI